MWRDLEPVLVPVNVVSLSIHKVLLLSRIRAAQTGWEWKWRSVSTESKSTILHNNLWTA